jgi:hypothetical protein
METLLATGRVLRCRSEEDEEDSVSLQEALEPHYIHWVGGKKADDDADDDL